MSHHETNVEYGGSPKTLKSYLIGFGLSMILTLSAFGLVEKRLVSATYLYILLGVLAIVQLLVQSTCFLRLNFSKEGRWNSMSFLFTLLIIGILAGGSFWIMFNLSHNMRLN